MSTVAPSESASQNGKKKNRPGKNARNAARGGQSSTVSSAPQSNASFFASQTPADPNPQPGKYPVVFRASVAEPTRDIEFAYDQERIDEIVFPLVDRYTFNPRYAEFSNNAGYTDSLFERDVARMFLLGLSQQTVHAHVNMGLPLGDFSSIASNDVFEFVSLAAVIRQFGEFSDPSLGSRYLLKDYASTVTSLVRAASQLGEETDDNRLAIRRIWIPTKAGDKRTKFILARALSKFFETGLGVSLSTDSLMEHLFSSPWDVITNLKPLLGDNDEAQDRFDFLFTSWTTDVQLVQKFTGAGPQSVLRELKLSWDHPDVSHLAFDFVAKVTFTDMVDDWARKRAAVNSFLSCTSGLANRTAASGTQAQVSEVSSSAGVVVVKTHSAQSAPELSLLACFPPSAVLDPVGPLNVVLTTSVSTDVRATEFLQLDWKG